MRGDNRSRDDGSPVASLLSDPLARAVFDGTRRMWCANCQADVAAEVTADNRRILCANCGKAIDSSPALRAAAKTREARELLQRWSSGPSFDPFGPPPNGLRERSLAPTAETSAAATMRRIDPPHTPAGTAAPLERPPVDLADEEAGNEDGPSLPPARKTAPRPERSPNPASTAESSVATQRRYDMAHTTHLPPATQPLHSLSLPKRKSSATAMTGQLLAYGGVLGLTIGTTMVIWGYFGGRADLAPTGWLMNTVGQMLLFLGVVTLVSGGLETTTEEVARRMDQLGERLLRIEAGLQDQPLQGPSVPAERFAEGRQPPASRTPSEPSVENGSWLKG